jgi:hypothetical protein
MSYNNEIWYKYRMEVMFNGEWREVGTSADRNQARSILNTEYGGRRDFRIKEAASDQVVDFQARSIIPYQELYAQQQLRNTLNEFRRLSQEIRSQYEHEYQNNGFFPEHLLRGVMTTERPRQTTTPQEQAREDQRYQDRISRLNRFEFRDSRPEPQRAVFVGFVGFVGIADGLRNVGFTKVTEPREKVNWKEEGF